MNTKLNREILDYYSDPGKMTSPGDYLSLLKKLPNDVHELTKIVQGLVIHQFTAADFYNFEIPKNRTQEAHIRQFHDMLDKILELDNQPLSVQRPPQKRLVGVCHHFAKMLVSMLRAKGTPARMRYGFGNYFNPGHFEDHSLCEYWNTKERRWVLTDPQFDNIWQQKLHIKHDVFDVPHDNFLMPSKAWQLCRNGTLDATKFGIFEGNLRGLWFIADNIVKDLASLNKLEMLQWDTWGGMPRPNNTMKNKKTLDFFDKAAEVLSDPDIHFSEIVKLYNNRKTRVKVPERVFNSLNRHLEWVSKKQETKTQKN